MLENNKTGQESPVAGTRKVKNLALVGSISTLPPAVLAPVPGSGFFDLSSFGHGFWPAIMLSRSLAIMSLPALGAISVWLASRNARRNGILMIVAGLLGPAALSAGVWFDITVLRYGGPTLPNWHTFPFLLSGTVFFMTGGVTALRNWRHMAAAPPESATAGREAISSKSRRRAVLFCLLMGWLGIHRFYLGRKVTAVIQLLWGVLGGILSLFLAILGAAETQAPFELRLAQGSSFFLGPLFFWLLYDLVSLWTGNMKDAEGRAVEKW